MLIFPQVRVPSHLKENVPPGGSILAAQKKGWVTNELHLIFFYSTNFSHNNSSLAHLQTIKLINCNLASIYLNKISCVHNVWLYPTWFNIIHSIPLFTWTCIMAKISNCYKSHEVVSCRQTGIVNSPSASKIVNVHLLKPVHSRNLYSLWCYLPPQYNNNTLIFGSSHAMSIAIVVFVIYV